MKARRIKLHDNEINHVYYESLVTSTSTKESSTKIFLAIGMKLTFHSIMI